MSFRFSVSTFLQLLVAGDGAFLLENNIMKPCSQRKESSTTGFSEHNTSVKMILTFCQAGSGYFLLLCVQSQRVLSKSPSV